MKVNRSGEQEGEEAVVRAKCLEVVIDYDRVQSVTVQGVVIMNKLLGKSTDLESRVLGRVFK